MGWKQTRGFDGPILVEQWERADGNWRVGSNRLSREKANPYYVQERLASGRSVRSPLFPRRFNTPEAAMAAVDKRSPVEPKKKEA